ncbi:MAG: hypothetical protein AAB370_07560 [Verrucomicrobiota bacterium]
MIERWKNDDGSETILVTDNPSPPPGVLRRGFGILGRVLLILLVTALPAYFLYQGITGIITEEFSLWLRRQGTHRVLHGAEAVGWSWLMIGFAIGYFPFVFRENLMPWAKWLLALLAVACAITGICQFINTP